MLYHDIRLEGLFLFFNTQKKSSMWSFLCSKVSKSKTSEPEQKNKNKRSKEVYKDNNSEDPENADIILELEIEKLQK